LRTGKQAQYKAFCSYCCLTDSQRVPAMNVKTLAKLACAYSGVAWGLFWFPLRWLEGVGVEGPWSAVVFYLVQFVCILPIVFLVRQRNPSTAGRIAITTFFAGAALSLYALSILYTEVIRAMLLFYLTPVWSTLLARMILGEVITRLRWLAIALALAGMLVILGIDVGVPWPRNIGDWMGLASGMMWAVAAVRLNQDRSCHPVDITFGFFTWGVLISFAAMLAPLPGEMTAPTLSAVTSSLWWLAPAVALVAVPGALAAMWGARLIDPGIVGILMMTEIVAGTMTVALWAGEPFGLREVTGVTLILLAGVLESVWELWKNRRVDLRPAA
jgi:drug/metabolite transporter (DMT)-like permease